MKRPVAIITGASGGIGSAYARELARRGYQLLLTGRNTTKLMLLKTDLEKHYLTNVSCFTADLSCSDSLDLFLQETNRLETVELLINNAGFGCQSDFFSDDYTSHLNMLAVHITAVVKLVHHIVPKMLKNGFGKIINVASLAAFMPAHYSYIYSPSKRFLVSFSECLSLGLNPQHITVQVLCPGFTKTEFMDNIDGNILPKWMKKGIFWMTPERVVRISLNALNRHNVIVIPGTVNKLLYRIKSLLPDHLYYLFAASKGTKSKTLHSEYLSKIRT
ncbi:SDR family NAD(P)-dependent oxidoreductase [Saccharicrinis sp. FJH54]|uniref:SDR family NAD(P)-dependent oxidoreductase n=1 Tax=Saccharicrinis sp. FJH54 TaxID=3344665 RepID=UPI0035D443E9